MYAMLETIMKEKKQINIECGSAAAAPNPEMGELSASTITVGRDFYVLPPSLILRRLTLSHIALYSATSLSTRLPHRARPPS
mmetsp:Transcript_1806/g.2999  ORF Transcript_1806/g.2999 Transcript_1806/m.2999 type:complete len:82 (-) Transcript_1806:6-251(-)